MTNLNDRIRTADPLAGRLPPVLATPALAPPADVKIVLGDRRGLLPRHWLVAAAAGVAGVLAALLLAGAFKGSSKPQLKPAAPAPVTSTTYTRDGVTLTERTEPGGIVTESSGTLDVKPGPRPRTTSVKRPPPEPIDSIPQDLHVSGMQTAGREHLRTETKRSIAHTYRTANLTLARQLTDGTVEVTAIPIRGGLCAEVIATRQSAYRSSTLRCGSVQSINSNGLVVELTCGGPMPDGSFERYVAGVAPDGYTKAVLMDGDSVVGETPITHNGFWLYAPEEAIQISLIGHNSELENPLHPGPPCRR